MERGEDNILVFIKFAREYFIDSGFDAREGDAFDFGFVVMFEVGEYLTEDKVIARFSEVADFADRFNRRYVNDYFRLPILRGDSDLRLVSENSGVGLFVGVKDR